MIYVGVDLHKDSMSIVGCDVKGNIVIKERIPCKCINKIEKFFSQDIFSSCWLAVEATGFYHWFYDLIKKFVGKVILVNPVEIRKYSWNNPKTDFHDATRMALLLAGGEFERNTSLSCFIPDNTIRTFRELTRYRFNLVCYHTSLVNSARRILLKNNLAGPKIINASSLEYYLSKFDNHFSLYHKNFLYNISENLFYNERQIKETEREIEKFLQLDRFKDVYEILTSIPGVGNMVAATIISEIGDFSRFNHPNKLASYCGLVPKVYQSDKNIRYGKITKNSTVFIRKSLINASWVAVRENERIRKIFIRISKRAGRKKAIVAIARKIVVWSWYLIKEQEKWASIATSNLIENKAGMTLMRLLKNIQKRENSIA